MFVLIKIKWLPVRLESQVINCHINLTSISPKPIEIIHLVPDLICIINIFSFFCPKSINIGVSFLKFIARIFSKKTIEKEKRPKLINYMRNLFYRTLKKIKLKLRHLAIIANYFKNLSFYDIWFWWKLVRS